MARSGSPGRARPRVIRATSPRTRSATPSSRLVSSTSRLPLSTTTGPASRWSGARSCAAPDGTGAAARAPGGEARGTESDPGNARLGSGAVTSNDHQDADVIVIGAGVIGLTCALVATEAGHRVRIVAEQTGRNTTSYAAG